MFKIWVKVFCEEKITKSILWESGAKFSRRDFSGYVYEICGTLDIPSPVILESHAKNFERFNIVKFVPRDFVETVVFGAVTMEFVKE
jgi:hypothetical protein